MQSTTWGLLVSAVGLGAAFAMAAAVAEAADEPRTVVYVSVGGANKIARFDLDLASGELKPADSTMAEAGPGPLAVDPAQRHLYASLRGTKTVATYRIGPDGSLKHQGTTPIVSDAVYMAVNPTGRYLLTAYYGAGKVATYPIGRDGVVIGDAVQVLETEKNPHAIRLGRDGKHVYVPNCGSDCLLQYSFNADGTLSAATPPRVATEQGAGPRHMAFHPTLDVVYVVNEKNSSATSYKLDRAAGTLTAMGSLPTLPAGFQGKNTCADIHVSPNGRWVYASNRGHDSLAMFAVDTATGKLTALGQQSTEQTPRSFAIDPSGKFVIAAGQGSGKLATYRIEDSTGKLQPLKTYEVGAGPSWVCIERLAAK